MARISLPLSALTDRISLPSFGGASGGGPISGRFANLRPIGEFFDFKRLSKPANFGEIQSRVNYNLSYFSTNYIVLFFMLGIYSLLTNLLLLFVILLVIGGMFGIGRLQGQNLELGFTTLTPSQLYTGLLVVSIPLGLIASPFSTILWLIGASGVSIFGHATFMDRPIENAFSQEAV